MLMLILSLLLAQIPVTQAEEEVSLLRSDGACPVVAMFPYTIGHGRWPADAHQRLSFSWAAATLLAMEHFNQRDASIVPELMDHENSKDQCTVYFPISTTADSESSASATLTILDSQMTGEGSVKGLWEATTKKLIQQAQVRAQTEVQEMQLDGSITNATKDELQGDNKNNTIKTTTTPTSTFCAVLGPMEPRAVEETAAITTALGLPHLFYFSESTRFWGDPDLAYGVTLTPNARAHILLQYLQQQRLQQERNDKHQDDESSAITYLAVLHFGKDGSSDLAEELRDLAKTGDEYYQQVHVELFLRSPGRQNTNRLLQQLYDSGITTVLLNFDNPRSIESMANGLQAYGMLTDDYVYLISPDALPVDERLNNVYGGTSRYAANENVTNLLSHALVLDMVDPFRLAMMDENDDTSTAAVDSNSFNSIINNNSDDPFLRTWRQQTPDFVQRVMANNPLGDEEATDDAYFDAPTDFFQTQPPNSLSSFVYDAVVALGMGACRAQQAASEAAAADANMTISTMDPPRRVAVGREQVLLHMRNLTFHGASGPFTPLPEDEAYRQPHDIQVGLYNIIPFLQKVGDDNGEDATTTITWKPVLTALWTKGEWTYKRANAQAGNEQDLPKVIYRSKTTTPPIVIRDMNHNYLSQPIRVVGFIIFGLTWVMALGSMMGVYFWRWTDQIQRGQPFFLHLICLGSLISSLAIFTLSFDEQSSILSSKDALSALCTMTVWFFFVGHILTYMALFSMLWRIDRVLQFRRGVSVKERHAIGPMLLLLTLTLLILILWTSMNPWTWQRDWVSRLPPETYGECACDNFWAYFAPLMALVIMAEVLAAIFAFKTFDVPDDFNDSRSVILAICMHVQSWVIGIPILVVLHNASAADATYMGRVLLVWVFSISSVLVVVGPRIYYALFLEGRGETGTKSTRKMLVPSNASDKIFVSGLGARELSSATSHDPISLGQDTSKVLSSDSKNRQNSENGTSAGCIESEKSNVNSSISREMSSSERNAMRPDEEIAQNDDEVKDTTDATI